MKKLVIAGVVSLVTVFGSSNALAQKPSKCVNPALSVVVADVADGLSSDGAVTYTDGVDGVYAKMNHCGGTDDIVLNLGDLSLRQMSLLLSNGTQTHVATRVDVTGVGQVTSGCDTTRTATIWFNANTSEPSGFLRFSAVNVCLESGAWTVQPMSAAARFDYSKGKYRYYQNETVPFEITVTQITQ